MDVQRSPLNDAQFEVLRWISEGCPSGRYVPDDSAHFASARALHNRGLINAAGHGRHWSASLTEEGRHYLEHGDYTIPTSAANGSKKQSAEKQSAQRVKQNVSPEPSAQTSAASINTECREESISEKSDSLHSTGRSETIPIPAKILRPHPAIRDLMKHRKRLDVPAEQQQRALIMLHALVQEALRRGWKVTANPTVYETDEWTGRRRSVSSGPDLFTIDAGDCPAIIRVSMKNRRVEHVPTDKEREHSSKLGWRSYPKYDYVPTDTMRIEIRKTSYSTAMVEDSKSVKLENKLDKVLDIINQMSEEVRQRAERKRQEEIERLEQMRRMEELRRKTEAYERWMKTLDQLRSDIVRHKEFEAAVELLRKGVEDRGPNSPYAHELGQYLAWAETYLRDSDPFRRIPLPPGGIPEMTYDEWIHRDDWQ
ncbi:hypothetical protein JS530_07725 [Bifidobacterium sp. LC6]|uniref:PE-PGRS family protein n=1 Tax=Bifidobacterium colobi TaxID=2809026 RepID=A0ABS5UW85_9BIFI|nr:hypothetical protein [Bifidobacterium colobi]MBT1175383.1 hypothetical protein [Bifidobacterium colobi]